MRLLCRFRPESLTGSRLARLGGAGPVLGVGQLLLFHQDRHELREGSDLLVLHADDRQQLKDHQEEEDRDTDEGEGVVLNAKLFGHPSDAVGPEGQGDEWQADQQEQQSVAFLEPICAKSAYGQQQEQPTECRQKHAADDRHATSPFRWARDRAPGPAAGRRSPSGRRRDRATG